MPVHRGLLPREGLCADVVLRLLRITALNPALLLPLILFARYTKKGQDLSVLHPTAAGRFAKLFWFALVSRLSAWFSDRARNNATSDRYDWATEIVLVTGGSGGIGGSMVRLFDEMGITTVVLDVQPLTYKTSPKVKFFKCDLRSPEKVKAIAEEIRTAVGNPTVIINNAGVARGKTLLGADPADIRFTFDVNTFALFWVAQAFLPAMVARNHGMVVTVASYASWLTIPNMVDYGASKAAALSFHEGITAELATSYAARRIRTVIVHPGHTRTPLFTGYDQKTGFLMPELEPETIAEAVVKQVLSGRAGAVIVPEMGTQLAGLRMMPDWYTVPLRAKAQSFMANWKGRQVIEDVKASFTGDGSPKNIPSESTVLVPEHGKLQ